MKKIPLLPALLLVCMAGCSRKPTSPSDAPLLSANTAPESYMEEASNYYDNGDYDNAILYLEQALEQQKQISGDISTNVANIYDLLANCNYFKGDYDSALGFYEKALAIYLEILGETAPDVVLTYSNIGTIYFNKRDYDNALLYCEKLLTIRLEVLGETHPDVILTYNDIGTVYYNKGDYDNALLYYKKVSDLQSIIYGEKSVETAASYYNIGNVYLHKGEYAISLTYHEKALAIRLEILGESHPVVAMSHNGIGTVYFNKGDYEIAVKHFETALAIYLQDMDENYLGMATAYDNIGYIYDTKMELAECYFFIGVMYHNNGDYDAALNYYEKSLVTKLEVLDENHISMTRLYNNIGVIYSEKGNYDTALKYYEHSLAVDLQAFGEFHSNTATDYSNIGIIYHEKCDYDTAYLYHKKALEIRLQVLGENHFDTAISYFNIGSIFYDAKYDYNSALEYYEKALDIYLKVPDEPHQYVATTYDSIGDAYFHKGEHDTSLTYYDRALTIRMAILGKWHPDIAASYCSIGAIYDAKGDYDFALRSYEEAISIYLKTLGEKHPDIAICYNSIANVYFHKGEYEFALQYYENSLAIRKQIFGENSPNIVVNYNNIGSIYNVKEDWDSAIDYYEKALSIDLKVFGETHCDTARDYHNIGTIYGNKGDHDSALLYFEKSLAIYLQVLGKINPDVATNYNNIAWAYLYKSDENAAIANWHKLYPIWQTSKNYADITNTLSGILFRSHVSDSAFIRETLTLATDTVERARLDMASLKEGILRRSLPVYYYGVQFEAQQKKPDRAFEYSESLRSRGFLDQVGTEAALRLDGVTETEREKVRSLVSQIAAARTEIERQNEKTLDERDKKRAADALKSLSDAEKSLAKLDAQIGKRIPAYAQLRNPVPVSAKNAQKWCGKNRAVLEYVLWNPELFDEEDAQVKSYCLVLMGKKITAVELDGSYDYAGAVNRLHERIARQARESQFESLRNELYEKLIAPVLPYVGGAKELVIVPDGSLSFLPFDILRKDSDAKMLGDRYAVAFSPSVSVSVLCDGYKASQNSMLAFGGAWYDKTLSEAEHRDVLSQEIPYSKPGSGWADLPGTLTEIGSLSGIFGADGFTQIVQEDAAERTVKNLSQSGELSRYGILHFACHGYFSKSENDQPTSLLFSEISGKFAETSGEDGYLTIPESAVLNLRADIVCLSACETALGEIKAGDGVVGLSRAFMVAGARHVGASLWEVDDTATAEFMRRMYEKVVRKGMDYVAAYQQTKAEFRKDEDFSHPVYWAAFVLYK